MESISRKQQIKKILEDQGKALIIEELKKYSGIPALKIRQTLTTFEHDIVRVSSKVWDLAERVYKGKTFRYTPGKEEIEKGKLKAEADLLLFLTACKDFGTDIILIDKNGTYFLKRNKTSRFNLFSGKVSYYRGLVKWYRKNKFEIGDDIIFTCLNLKEHKFSIQHQKKKDRDEFLITIKNKKLADLIFDILVHTLDKYDMDMFLFRKYLYLYPFNDPVPPDHLEKALFKDKRFLLSTRDKMLSWTGHPLEFEFTIGLRKYYFQNEKKEFMPVFIDEDEFGKFGFCVQCEHRLIWEKDCGWRRPNNDSEEIEAHIPKEFFQVGKKKLSLN